MDRYVMESRMKELIHRTQRLKRYIARKAEGSHGELEALLLENIDVTAELAELSSQLLEQQVKLTDNSHGFDYSEDYDGEEMFMMCPYCHESVNVSMSDMDQQSTQCPNCHSRLQLYSPS